MGTAFQVHRRAALAGAAALALAGPARAALTAEEAQRFIEALIVDLEAILQARPERPQQIEKFMALFKRVSALPQIARFAAGTHWRAMSEAQQNAYLSAFERYAARAYTDNIGEYRGQTVEVVGASDAGRRGVLVNTLLKSPGEQDIKIDWLVSDRSGATLLSDIVAEGVSLAIAQREEFSAMIERRGGDLDRFIADLGA